MVDDLGAGRVQGSAGKNPVDSPAFAPRGLEPVESIELMITKTLGGGSPGILEIFIVHQQIVCLVVTGDGALDSPMTPTGCPAGQRATQSRM